MQVLIQPPFRCVSMSKMQGVEDEDDRSFNVNDLVRIPTATQQIGHDDTPSSGASERVFRFRPSLFVFSFYPVEQIISRRYVASFYPDGFPYTVA